LSSSGSAKPPGLGEDAVDQPLRHAVSGKVEEPDILQREPQLGRGAFERTRLAGETGGDVEDRDAAGVEGSGLEQSLAHRVSWGVRYGSVPPRISR